MQDLTEEKLFQLLRDNMYEDLVRVSGDEYSANDCWSQEYGAYIELKCRRTHYPTLMLEKVKYDRLTAEANALGMLPVYICSTPQGIWSFNLDLIKLKWEDMDNLPATTDFDNTDKVTKTVAMLDINLGTPLLPWYPEWESEDAFLNDTLASEAAYNSVIEDADLAMLEAELLDDNWEDLMLSDNENWGDLEGEVN